MGNRGVIHLKRYGACDLRTNRTAVQQVVWANVGGVVLFTADLVRNVFALDTLPHHLKLRRVFGLGLTHRIHGVANGVVPLHGSGKIFTANQCGISDGLGWFSQHKNTTVFHAQGTDGHTQMFGACRQQHAAGFGSSIANRLGTHAQTSASAAATLVGGEAGVSHDDVHLVIRHIKLISHKLGNGHVQALATIHLAKVHGHQTVFANAQPSVQSGRMRAYHHGYSSLGRSITSH